MVNNVIPSNQINADMRICVSIRGDTCVYTIEWCNNRFSRRHERQQIQLSNRKGTPQTVVTNAVCSAVKSTLNTCYTI